MRERIKKHTSIYNLLLMIYSYTEAMYYYIFLLIFSIFKIDNKKIVIVSYSGKGYGDNGKYICNNLIKYNYNIYWATKKEYKSSLPKEIKYIEFNSLKYLYHLATAKIWINNSRFGWGTRKRKKQFYIQTWHGGIGFKKIDAAAEKNLSKYYVLSAKNDSKIADLLISNSKFCTDVYKNDFRYDGSNILECGSPRNDLIINHDTSSIQKIRRQFGLSTKDKICLYAPTFRTNTSLDVYNISYNSLINELKNKFKGNWKILIKLHPHISHLTSQLSNMEEGIINASEYPDMQELLIATDFLITDYSSCIFDYALSKKPAILYASDIKEFDSKERDFIIKPKDTPFSIASNNKELKHIIEIFDIDKYENEVDKFYKNMGLKETGKACEEITKIIKYQIKK